MCSVWHTEFTKPKVVVMRTEDWKSGNLNSRLRKASTYNMILDKLGAYFGPLISPMIIMRRLDQRSQRDLFLPGHYLNLTRLLASLPLIHLDSLKRQLLLK